MISSFTVPTKGKSDIVNITDNLQEEIANNSIERGQLTVFTPHSTAAITTIEYEPGLLDDFKKTLSVIVSNKNVYKHNQKWGDGNAVSHIKASLVGPSLNLLISNNKLLLGTWQQVVLIDFDLQSRDRKVYLDIIEGVS